MRTLEVKPEANIEPAKNANRVDQFKHEIGLIRRGLMGKLFWSGVFVVAGIRMCDSSDERQSKKEELSEGYWDRLLNGTQKGDQQESIDETEETYFDRLPQEQKVVERQIAPGIVIRDDNGIFSYKRQPGDNIEKIREKLSRIPDFAYLENQKQLQPDKSFNFPNTKDLKLPEWIPIPFSNRDRKIPRQALKRYCEEAINDLLSDDSPYSRDMQQVLASIPDRNVLLAFMMAIAKQESGAPNGGDVGTLEFHRWEKDHDCFSFSMYHVMMCNKKEGENFAGNRARKKLGKTESQLLHPLTGAKLFLAYIFERLRVEGRSLTDRFFPFEDEDKANAFAKFYNGRGYHRSYPVQTKKYYQEALQFLAQQKARKFAFNQK